MQIQTRNQSGISILTLVGDVDLEYSPLAREHILRQLDVNRHLLVDLSGVSYIDSSGVASLVEGYQKAKQVHGSFGLIGLSASAKQVLQLARLDQIFTIYDCLDDALKQAC